MTAIPAPSPDAIAITLMAYARLLRGISSATTTAIRKSSARPEGATDRLRRDQQREVRRQRAERAGDRCGPGRESHHPFRGRPGRRSPPAAGRSRCRPGRCSSRCRSRCRSTPKSSAANCAVWVNRVLVNADDIDAAARRPSTSAWRSSIRSGGAHHGGLVRVDRATALQGPTHGQGEDPARTTGPSADTASSRRSGRPRPRPIGRTRGTGPPTARTCGSTSVGRSTTRSSRGASMIRRWSGSSGHVRTSVVSRPNTSGSLRVTGATSAGDASSGARPVGSAYCEP